MLIEVVKELEAAKAKVAELQQSLDKELTEKLTRLPAEFGFSDLDSFIKALKSTAGPRPRKPRAKSAKKPKAGKSGKRARITPEVKAQVKALLGQDKTGAEIAKEIGISLPSVQNIKKELGLVKARK
jgi:hypothetical protein